MKKKLVPNFMVQGGKKKNLKYYQPSFTDALPYFLQREETPFFGGIGDASGDFYTKRGVPIES